MKEIDFSRYSSIKIGPTIDIKVVDEVVEVDEFLIGGANNLLISNKKHNFAILSDRFDYIKEFDDIVVVGAKTKSTKLFSWTKKHNIKGFEFLSHLPGTLGGLVKMNAGMKEYEIFDNLLYIKTNKGEFSKDELNFGYRYLDIKDTIFEVGFKKFIGFDFNLLEHFKNMRKNQPTLPSAGSCFKNGIDFSAGKLLDLAGFRGKRLNNIGFSQIHANFLINYGGGSFDDAIYLIKEAKEVVFKKFNKILENEIIII